MCYDSTKAKMRTSMVLRVFWKYGGVGIAALVAVLGLSSA